MVEDEEDLYMSVILHTKFVEKTIIGGLDDWYNKKTFLSDYCYIRFYY
jgi:hypothetical protein